MKIHRLLLLLVFFIFTNCAKNRDYFEEAYNAYKENDLGKALELLDIAIAQDSTCKRSKLLQSSIKIESETYEAIAHDYQTILEYEDKGINYDYPTEEEKKFYYVIAMSYYHTGDIDRFFEYYQAFIPPSNFDIDFYTRSFAIWEYGLPQTPEDYYWYGIYFENKKELLYAYYYLEYAAQYDFRDAYLRFQQVAKQLNRPEELLDATFGKPTEITFTDGSVLLLDQQLDPNTNVDDYELISVEEKQLMVDYVFCYNETYHYSDIMISLIEKHTPQYSKIWLERYVEIAWNGKKVGFNLMLPQRKKANPQQGKTDVLVYRFNTPEGEKNFLIGFGYPEFIF